MNYIGELDSKLFGIHK